ncbi:head maturation protease, ClpP-related [Pseudogracilibacillus auburnensis]|uniref:head maturation protease, ClpP-related n=1 Tax=Pseudogracilibacillus auburnensis TaxID=1494959 RepID=UPI001A974603|nr:head maturation protease, ClpP-related [Pseudogracilibacillus auburnensis]MBO1005613.1 Clp protease ClpP [Pseudogracilibacillus auburnensis]
MFKNQKYVEQLKKIPQNFKVEHDEENKVTEITIYGVIGSSWWSESFSANDIDKALNKAGDNDIVINLNSPGGDAFDGISIFNRLKRHNGKVTIHVDGWACSAASIIAMAGDEIVMELGSMMMIHEASNIVWGTKRDMRKEADVLEELEEGVIDIYSTKALIQREDIREKMDAETWMSAKTAVELGFADDATGVDFDGEPEPKNTVRSSEEIKGIFIELQNVLGPNNQEEKEPEQQVSAKRKGFFF